jgi:dipeptidyl aminopeptidase/acylaminoacyl peptidase
MSKRPVSPEDLASITFVGEPRFDPAGEHILFGKKVIDAKNRYVTQLATVDADGNVKILTSGENGASHGRWSPDGRQIAFLAKRGETAQIHLLPTDGGEAHPLTTFEEGSIGGFQWSPDGKYIALTFRATLPERTEAAKKAREEKGLSQPPIEIDDIWYRLDGDGYFGAARYRLMVIPTEGDDAGVPILIYDADSRGMYSYGWFPDSQWLVVVCSAAENPWRDKPDEQLYLVSLDGKANMIAGLPKGEKSDPKVSPDGQWIVYAGDVSEDDPWGVRNTKLYAVRPDGTDLRDLTGHLDYDLAVTTLSDTGEAAFGAVFTWSADSQGLFAQLGHHGETQIAWVPLTGGVDLLTSGHHTIALGNVTADGRIAATVANPTQPAEVASVEREIGTGQYVPRLRTGFNLPFTDELQIRVPQEVWVESTDGVKVHTWFLLPEGDGPHPVALCVHGGPHAQYGWAFFHEFQVLASAGYAVVYSNPRGSKGYGEDFCAAIRGDWGNKDWDDVQAVTDWIRAQPWANPDRIGIMGGSYGGYMTNWAIGHRHDYACAITDRCVSNMVSMSLNSDFPFNKDGYFKGEPWGDLEAIRELWRQSPIASFGQVSTPTLVIHSEGDLRCNVEQGEQVFAALQARGIPTRFVRYPATTSHGLSRSGPPDLRYHRQREYLAWLEKYLKA